MKNPRTTESYIRIGKSPRHTAGVQTDRLTPLFQVYLRGFLRFFHQSVATADVIFPGRGGDRLRGLSVCSFGLPREVETYGIGPDNNNTDGYFLVDSTSRVPLTTQYYNLAHMGCCVLVLLYDPSIP